MQGKVGYLLWNGVEGLPELHGSVPTAAQIRALAAVIWTTWFREREGTVVFSLGYQSTLPLKVSVSLDRSCFSGIGFSIYHKAVGLFRAF